MKKLLSLFLVFALIFAFGLILGSCSCNGNTDNNENQGLKWDTSRNVLKMEVIDGNLYVTYEDDQNNSVNLGKLLNGEVEWTTSLSFHPLNDGTYGVKVGNAKELSDIVIPSEFNSGAVTKIMAEGFKDCGNLKNITIPSSVKSVEENAFNGCSIETVSAPACAISSLPKNTVKKFTVNGGMLNDEGMFASFTVLTDVAITKDVPSISGKAFNGCDTITNYTVEEDSERYKSVNGTILTVDEKALVRYANGKTETSLDVPNTVLYISSDSFNGCKNITSITLSNVELIESNAFNGCTSLEVITIGAGVKNIGENAFASCPIKEATLPTNALASIEKGSITKVTLNGGTSLDGGAFYDCPNLTTVTLSKDIASVNENAFIKCPSLTSIEVDENNTSFKSIEGNLYSYDEKTIVKYAQGKKETSYAIPVGVATIANSAFYDAINLVSITIPNTVTSIGNEAFCCCSNLASITIPDSVTSMGIAVFVQCVNLESVTLSNGITTIEKGTFMLCEKLTSVTIPSKVTFIDSGAFASCTSLKSIVIPSTVTEMGLNVFIDCSDITIDCEASEKPNGWNDEWCEEGYTVNWSYVSE